MNYYKIIDTNGVDLGKHCMTKIISEEELVKIENYYFLNIESIKLDQYNKPLKKEEKNRILN
tara:strand:+ start:30 stop:215 length:186 start_codon:yes stop_codon:yes gene_type:complete